LLALALAASDIIRTTPAQMRATVRNLPMHMPIDEKSAPSLPRRRLRSAQVRFLAPGPAAPSASSGIANGQLPVFVEEDQRAGARRRKYVAARCCRTASGTMPISLAVGKQPLRLGRSPSMARRACGQCASKEKCRQALRQGIVTLGDVVPSALPPP